MEFGWTKSSEKHIRFSLTAEKKHEKSCGQEEKATLVLLRRQQRSQEEVGEEGIRQICPSLKIPFDLDRQLYAELDNDDDISPYSGGENRVAGDLTNAVGCPEKEGHLRKRLKEIVPYNGKSVSLEPYAFEDKLDTRRKCAGNMKYGSEKIFDNVCSMLKWCGVDYLLWMVHHCFKRRAPVPIRKADTVMTSASSTVALCPDGR
ncbi:unnamed protein product [Angiostrongylus costaricensis]|uniref:DDE_Tnp_1_7 domain-containing protein n=1 Tax=Angiostrongylus costaricensis TaxID=334426 RepID=A0A0R3PTL3_ANGCS|nr:unnamed protein product [Angiostrongylus costaricensis]